MGGLFVVRTSATSLARGPSHTFGFRSPMSSGSCSAGFCGELALDTTDLHTLHNCYSLRGMRIPEIADKSHKLRDYSS